MIIKKFIYKSVNSTNDIAINLIKKKNFKAGLVVTEKQKKGKGQKGKRRRQSHDPNRVGDRATRTRVPRGRSLMITCLSEKGPRRRVEPRAKQECYLCLTPF